MSSFRNRKYSLGQKKSTLDEMFEQEFGIPKDKAVLGNDGKFVDRDEKEKVSTDLVMTKSNTVRRSSFSIDDEATVPKREMDKKVSELNERITKLSEKNESLKADNAKLRKSLESAELRLKEKTEELEKLKKAN